MVALGVKVTWWTFPARSMGKPRLRNASWIAGDVLVHLAHRAEADLAEDEDQGLGGEGFVPALSLHYCSLGLQ